MQNEFFRLEEIADGALVEQIDDALQKVFENIANPNTPVKKKRKLNIVLTFAPDSDRVLAHVDIEVKPTLAPASPTQTRVLIDQDSDGNIVGAEYRTGNPGQVAMIIDKETGEVSTGVNGLPPGLKIVGK